MSAIVFSLSSEASEYVRAYCAKTGASLDGLACIAVHCLIDLLDDDYGGPWAPEPTGLAKGVDTDTLYRALGSKAPNPTEWLAAQLTEAVLCSIAGAETRAQAEGRRMADKRFGVLA